MLFALFVIARIFANPVSNLFQKQLAQRSANPAFIVAATHALLTIVCLPLAFPPPPDTDFWTNMVISAVLAVAGNVLLVYALESTGLSVLGPINAYKSVIGLVLAIFLIGEVPTRTGLVGVAFILAGSYFVVDRNPDQPCRNAFAQFFRERGIRFRLLALVLSATEAVFLKKALLLSSPVTTFVWWSILGLPVAAVVIVVRKEPVAIEVARVGLHWTTYLALATTTGVMQLATLLTFGKLQVGYSLALFQLSALVSVFLGHRYFQESNIGRRLVASLIMIAGAVLIVTRGRGAP